MGRLGLMLIPFAGAFFFCGVLCPLFAMAFYPLYRKFGGKKRFKDYMRSL